MILVDRNFEPQKCPLCQKDYDDQRFRPQALIPCGHSFCTQCLSKFERACKICAMSYNQIIPDYDMIDLVRKAKKISIDSSASSHPEDVKALKPEVYHLIMSGTKHQQLMGTQVVRKILSVESKPPIQEIVDAGLVPKFVEFLDEKQHPTLQFESAWALINVASGNSTQTEAVIKAGAIPPLVKLLSESTTNDDLQEQAVWALGNIAGDSAQNRDLVLEAGIIEPLLKILQTDGKKQSLINNAAWCLSNLCRGKPAVNLELVKPSLPVINQLLDRQSGRDSISDLCWALSYLSDGSNEQIQAIIDNTDLKKLLELLEKEDARLTNPVLRVFGNIATGSDEQTQRVIELGIVDKLNKFVDHPKISIRVEVSWFLSNLTAGTKDQIQTVIDSGVIQKLRSIYSTADDAKLKNEIAWVFANTTSGGSESQIRYIVENGAIELLLEHMNSLIGSSQKNKAKVAVEGLENIVKIVDFDQPEDMLTKKVIELEVEDEIAKAKEMIN